MKRITTIFLCSFIHLISYAQNLNLVWAKQMQGTSANGNGYSIVLDGLGNVYTIGSFDGSVDFDPGVNVFNLTSEGDRDIFISKLDSAGNFVWAKRMGEIDYDFGSSIAVDVTGNVYSTGFFWGICDFDPGVGVYNLTSDGGHDVFISKLDPSGNFLWAKKIGGAEADWGRAITVDASGNVYTTGEFWGTVDFDPGGGTFNLTAAGAYDIFVEKLDATGNFVWAKNSGLSSANFGFAIKTDGSGNVYTAGAIGFDIFISKSDAAGNELWLKQMTGPYYDLAYSMTIDSYGNVYTTGIFADTVDFDPGPGIYNLSSGNNWDVFISKLDTDGNFVWAKQLGGSLDDESHSIALDGVGNVYTIGVFRGTADFDPGPGTFNLTAAGTTEVFISKLDPSGNFSWAKQMSQGYGGYSLTVNASANIFVTGGFLGTVDFDPGPGSFNLTALGEDIFVQKLNQCVNNSSATISVSVCGDYILNGQSYTASGIYTQSITNATGCDSVIILNLTITNKLYSTITQSICAGQNYSGHSASGIYVDTLVSANGCDSIRTLQLTVLAKPVPDLGVDKELCIGDSLTLYPGQFNSYQWQNGTTQNSFSVRQAGLYSVAVTNNCGTAKDEILIKEKTCDIYFPSGFTPNGDGKNDFFKILGAYNLSSYHLAVYNRWGQKVFETSDYLKGWDGFFKGQLQGIGIFVWFCEFKKTSEPNKIKMKGTAALLK